jgi:hypothetical protein
MEEIIKELENSNKFLDNNFKNSNYYREYLDKLCEDLKFETTKLKQNESKRS